MRQLALAAALIAAMTTTAHAQGADDPELIFKKTTVWRMLSPDAKLATYALDDPLVQGVACHFTVPEIGGWTGWAGICRGALGDIAGLPPGGPGVVLRHLRTGRGHVPPAPVAVLQEDADRAWLRRRAQRAGLSGVFRPHHRGLAAELHVHGADHAMGRRARPALRGVSQGL
jgi:hypothetical protein